MRKFLGFIVWLIYSCLRLTWRVRLIEPGLMQENLRLKAPMVLAHWHGDELALVWLARRYRIATMASTSKDGEMMNVVLRLLGASTSRGSSTRGAITALKGLLSLMRKGHNCSFAVDGPKGPRHQVKAGVFEVARVVQAPIFTAGVEVDRAWRFEKAWNKTYLPKPFAKVTIVWTGPFAAPTKDMDPRSEQLALELKDALHNAQTLAVKKFAHPPVGC